MTLETIADSATLKQAYDDAYGAGIVVVAAVGKNGNSEGAGNNAPLPPDTIQ